MLNVVAFIDTSDAGVKAYLSTGPIDYFGAHPIVARSSGDLPKTRKKTHMSSKEKKEPSRLTGT
jgi:hypothetical protein